MHNLSKSVENHNKIENKGDYPCVSNGVVFAAIIEFIGFFVLLMAFCSPYWIQSFEETRSSFKNMGIWQYCFQNFVPPKTQFSKPLTGCHNVYSHEYYIIREYLLPGWLLFIQAFVTLSVLITACILSILSLTIMRLPLKIVLKYEWLLLKLSYFGSVLTSAFMLFAVIIFGACAYRRDWLMYPKFNVFGWSYVLAVVSVGLFVLAAFTLSRETRKSYERRDEQKNLVMQIEMQEPAYKEPLNQASQSRSLHGFI